MTELTWKQDAESLDKSRALSAGGGQPGPEDAPRIPGYSVIEKLGEGQYGAVWKAMDLNAKIPVAVKIFHHSGGLDYALLRGEVEKLIALCEDHRIVGLREVGWDADPPYFVMDYLENSLEKRLRSGPMPLDEAVDMFDRIVAGMVSAHNKGILHCDLKPGNILLDHDSQPLIADFGQSRLSTQHTPALGTLFYMAPEQADLKGVPDTRWDVYSLGAMLHCMLTGAAPYQTVETRKQLSEADTAPKVLARYREILQDSAKPTDHHGVPGIDRGLIEIIDRCLERDIQQRYANAQAIREALRRRARWSKQKPVLALGIALPLVFLLLLGVAFWSQITKAYDAAVAKLVSAAEDSNRSLAAAVNGSAARQFDRRWRSLISLAEKKDFRDALKQWSSEAAETRSGKPESAEFRQAAEHLHEKAKQHLDAEFQGTNAVAWFVLDHEGYMAAFADQSGEAPAFVGRRFEYRDYFKGIMRQNGIENVHVSRAFHPSNRTGGQAEHHTLVFSVAVEDEDDAATQTEANVIGVLCMAVPVGVFLEVLYPNLETQDAEDSLKRDTGWIPQIATLVDTRSSEPLQGEGSTHPVETGLVLQHAYYKLYGEERHQGKYENYPQKSLPLQTSELLAGLIREATRVYDESLPQFKAAGESANPQDAKRKVTIKRNEDLAKRYAEKERELAESFIDPFGSLEPRFAAEKADGWVMSARPIFVQRPGKAVPTNTNLVVLVQQRKDVISRAASDMTSSMLRRAMALFAVAGVLMLAVWFYGFSLLNPASQSRFTRAIWRFTGLGTTRSARGSERGTGWSSRSGGSARV